MKHRAITFASAAFFVTSLALASDTWVLDSSKSNARLFPGSRTNSELVNTGIARVSGKVKLNTNDLDASFFDLSIYPADEDWGYALSPEGTLPTGYVSGSTDRTVLTFKSTRILMRTNGKLAVIGDLTLTRVDRSVAATPTEAYAGPVYGEPAIHIESREITFLFPSEGAAHLAGPLTPAVQQTKGVLEIAGSARLIAATGDDNCHMPASVGEDYSGPRCTPATGNQSTIVLDLKFLHKIPEPSVGMLSANGAAR